MPMKGRILFQHFKPAAGVKIAVRVMAVPGMATGDKDAVSAVEKCLDNEERIDPP